MVAILDRINAVRSNICEAAAKSGRSEADVALIAISKTHPAERIQEAVDAGQVLFGESRVQEAKGKIPLLPGRCRWHFIGHLQSNKIRQALPLFERIHGIDSLDLARDVNRVASDLGMFPPVLLQVNVAAEASKHGFSPVKLEECFEEILRMDRLQVDGLMAIPPPVARAEDARRYFVVLRELRDRLAQLAGIPLPELSMGMSGDYAIAVEEGATMVRVGTAIFGDRS